MLFVEAARRLGLSKESDAEVKLKTNVEKKVRLNVYLLLVFQYGNHKDCFEELLVFDYDWKFCSDNSDVFYLSNHGCYSCCHCPLSWQDMIHYSDGSLTMVLHYTWDGFNLQSLGDLVSVLRDSCLIVCLFVLLIVCVVCFVCLCVYVAIVVVSLDL
jgi:hypothetical protein